MLQTVGKYVPDSNGNFVWQETQVKPPSLDNATSKLLFIVEAQLFHGCTRNEAVMLWEDGIDTLYDTVSEEEL
jgi:hypothetical protein